MSAPVCNHCCEPIRFFKTPAGNWMPCDLEPSEHAGIVHVREGVAHVVGGKELVRLRAEGFKLYVPHWATCTVPAAARRPPRARKTRKREPGQLELGGVA